MPNKLEQHRSFRDSNTEINRVSIRMPSLWKDNASILFTQLESRFVNDGVTADNKWYHTVAENIETKILSQVNDIVSPSTENA